MCFVFRQLPDDPPPEPVRPLTDLDRLADDVLAFAIAWSAVRFRGLTAAQAGDARRLVQAETQQLEAYHQAMEAGL
jgi:hypothetical protein